MAVKRQLLLLLLVLCSCSDDEGQHVYSFRSLSTNKLINLKKISEKIEGLYLTTKLSDMSSSSRSDSPIYVCIRFLNDKRVNARLKKSAIPLLIQISRNNITPQAEAVMLLHPHTKGVLYYEENQAFHLPSQPFIFHNREYDILDLHFNKDGKLTDLYLKEQSVAIEDLNHLVSNTPPSANKHQNTHPASIRYPILNLNSFVKIPISDCYNWSSLRYKLSDNMPEYLKTLNKTKAKNTVIPHDSSLPPVTPPPLIEETEPFKPVPKI